MYVFRRYLVLYVGFEEIFTWEFWRAYGTLGVFVISFLGNAIPYSTIPYFAFIIVYASSLKTLIDQIIVSFAGGLGAALGKVIVYYIGRGVRKALSHETKMKMKVLTDIAGKNIFFAVFLFAALPLPDDILYVPVGVSGYSIVKFFIALLSGKIIITSMGVFFGSLFGFFMEAGMGYPWYITMPILLVLTVVVTYVIVKIDWIKVAEVSRSKGALKAMTFVTLESFKVIIRPIIKALRKFH